MLLLIFHEMNIMVLSKKSFVTFRIFGVLFTYTAFKSGETGIGVPEALIQVIVALSALIYFFPVWFLYRFSKHMAHAVQTLDKQEIHKAFKYLKSYFVYLGILLIVVLFHQIICNTILHI